jgi:hypothetical protein
MQADYSVELGAEDPILSVPWGSPGDTQRYLDLRRQPDLLLYIEEAIRFPQLGEFLTHVNGERSQLQSAKCDAWFTTELIEEEQIYGAPGKFGSYVDLFFITPEQRSSFAANEEFAIQLSALLNRAPELPSSVEITIRRAYFGADSPVAAADAGQDGGEDAADDAAGSQDESGSEEGCYFTLYVFGYGDEEEEARRHWAVSLNLVQNALFQLAGQRPQTSP